jgi:hypothetical protein
MKAAETILRELREQFKLMAELEGKLATQPQMTLNIYVSTQWAAVGDLLSYVLGDYPDLRVKVAQELLALQEGRK